MSARDPAVDDRKRRRLLDNLDDARERRGEVRRYMRLTGLAHAVSLVAIIVAAVASGFSPGHGGAQTLGGFGIIAGLVATGFLIYQLIDAWPEARVELRRAERELRDHDADVADAWVPPPTPHAGQWSPTPPAGGGGINTGKGGAS